VYSIAYGTLQNADNEELNEIINRCLKDMNRDSDFSADEAKSFTEFYGDITGSEEPELILAIKFNNCTLVPVYEKNGDKYIYKCELGPFYDVESIDFRYMDNISKNAVFIREKVNQSLGCFESTVYLKGYAFIDDIPTPVISLPVDIEAYWNENFSLEGSEDKWLKISQKSNVNWIGGDCPEIILTKEQDLSGAEGSCTNKINADTDFIAEDSRTVTEKYTWSNKWNRFILDEKTHIPTGEAVAVLEDFSTQPYILAGFENAKSRVLFGNGDIKVVENSQLK